MADADGPAGRQTALEIEFFKILLFKIMLQNTSGEFPHE